MSIIVRWLKGHFTNMINIVSSPTCDRDVTIACGTSRVVHAHFVDTHKLLCPTFLVMACSLDFLAVVISCLIGRAFGHSLHKSIHIILTHKIIKKSDTENVHKITYNTRENTILQKQMKIDTVSTLKVNWKMTIIV